MTPNRGGVQGRTLEAGLIAEVAGTKLYDASGNPVWMGPGVPSAPVPPEGTPSRAWDFPVLHNVYRTTDAGKASESGVTMTQLRLLSQQTHVRAVIETVKDKQSRIEWEFAVAPLPGERRGDTEKRRLDDPRVREVSEFFESPDLEHDLSDWIRIFLEDVLVLDAPSVYRQGDIGGAPFALEVFDGATIQPMIDASGRRPRGFNEDGTAETAYQQWIKGVPFANFGWDEFMYAPRNPRPGRVFGHGPTEQLLAYINIAIRKDLTRLSNFTDGNIPAGLLPMPASWNSDQIEKWFNSFNSYLSGNIHNLVKLFPIPSGVGSPVFPQLDLLKNDTWEEVWLRLVCFVYGVSPSSLLKQQTYATAGVSKEQADEEGEQVYTDFIRRRLNWMVAKWFGYRDIVARPRSQRSVEEAQQAEIDDKRLRTGVAQVNEIRERDGLEPIAELAGRNGYFSQGGFEPFDTAIARSEATAIAAANPPDFSEDGDDEDREPDPPKDDDAEKLAPRVSIPLANGRVIRVNAGDLVKTSRGLIPVDELVTGDQLITPEIKERF